MPATEYYALTPSEFYAIVLEHRKVQRRSDSWMAKLCYVVATTGGAKLEGDRPIPYDFFAPWYKPPVKRKTNPIDQLVSLFPDRIIDLRKKKHGK